MKNGSHSCQNMRLKEALNAMSSSDDFVSVMPRYPDLFQPVFIQMTQVGCETNALEIAWAQVAGAYRKM